MGVIAASGVGPVWALVFVLSSFIIAVGVVAFAVFAPPIVANWIVERAERRRRGGV